MLIGDELTKGVHLAFFAFVHLLFRALALQTHTADLAAVADSSWRRGLLAANWIHELCAACRAAAGQQDARLHGRVVHCMGVHGGSRQWV